MANNRNNQYGGPYGSSSERYGSGYTGRGSRYGQSDYHGSQNSYGVNSDYSDDIGNDYGDYNRGVGGIYDSNSSHNNINSGNTGYARGNDYGRYSTDHYTSGPSSSRSGFQSERYSQGGSGYSGGYGMSRGSQYYDDDNYATRDNYGDYGSSGRRRDNYYSGSSYGYGADSYGDGIYGGSRHVGVNYGSNYYSGEHDSRNIGRYSGYYGPSTSGMTRNEHAYDGFTGDDYPGSER